MEHGVVYYRNLSGGMFVVMVNAENFLVFETDDVVAFRVGDIIYGNLSECGHTEILNANTQKSYSVMIQNVGCNMALAIDKAKLL